jgi:hypothetical protein
MMSGDGRFVMNIFDLPLVRIGQIIRRPANAEGPD